MNRNISDKTLFARQEQVRKMCAADTKRHLPSPLGNGFLNRNDRYNELLWQLTPEVERRIAAYEGR